MKITDEIRNIILDNKILNPKWFKYQLFIIFIDVYFFKNYLFCF